MRKRVRVLITGEHSYVGNHLEMWIKNKEESFVVDKVSMRNDAWRHLDLSEYDSIVHVAALVHRKETKEMEQQYIEVNVNKTKELAVMAKEAGVSQFVFLSSMSVYGVEEGEITNESKLSPTTYYGKTKMMAEKCLQSLESEKFKVAIVRAPMVYGKGCSGNYKRLSILSEKTYIFPDLINQRSMIYISNLCEFLYLIIKKNQRGIFMPQNATYVSTKDLVQEIAAAKSHPIIFTRIANIGIRFGVRRIAVLKKLFGNLRYDRTISEYEDMPYQIVGFEQSIMETET